MLLRMRCGGKQQTSYNGLIMLLRMRFGGKQQTPDDGLMMNDDKPRKRLEGMLAIATTASMRSIRQRDHSTGTATLS